MDPWVIRSLRSEWHCFESSNPHPCAMTQAGQEPCPRYLWISWGGGIGKIYILVVLCATQVPEALGMICAFTILTKRGNVDPSHQENESKIYWRSLADGILGKESHYTQLTDLLQLPASSVPLPLCSLFFPSRISKVAPNSEAFGTHWGCEWWSGSISPSTPKNLSSLYQHR